MLGLLMLHRSLIKYTDTFDSQTLNPGFHKKIYELVCERIRLNQDIDLIHFSDILSDNEMGRLSGIMARAADSSNPDAEFKDCMQIVGEEFTKAEKKKTDMKHISDDEFRKLFQ